MRIVGRVSAKDAVRAARVQVTEGGRASATRRPSDKSPHSRVDGQKLVDKRPRSRPWRTGKLERRGTPCPGRKGGAGAWPKMMWQAVSVLTSRDVPEEVYDYRFGKCRVCPYATVFVADNGERAHFCGCCGCPHSATSAMENKCRHARLGCSAPAPEFGPWKPGMESAGERMKLEVVDPSSLV